MPESDREMFAADRRVLRWVMVAAFGVYLAMLLQAEPLQSANDRSRWATVRALLEQGTFIIDDVIRRPGWDSIDKVRHDGHFYSSKPPLLAVIAAALTWGVTTLTRWTVSGHTAEVARSVLVLLNLIPAGIAVWLLDRMAERFARRRFTRWMVTLTALWGTLLSPFLMTLNNHTVAAMSVVFTVAASLAAMNDERRRAWPFAVAGFFAAMTCCHELPAAAFSTAVFLILARLDGKRTAIAFVPAALVPLAAFFITNYIVTGGIKPFYMYYGTEKYEYVVDGIPSYWMNPQGIDRNVDTFGSYLFHCLLGHHGWFSLTPIFLLMPAGWWLAWKRFGPLRLWILLGAGLWLLVLGFYLTRTENYNFGGVSVALRWLLWLIPFALLSLIPALDAWSDRRRVRSGVLALLVLSTVSAWIPMPNPWQQTWLFHVMTERGWIDYSTPPEPLPQRLWTWFGKLPDTDGCQPWQEFERVTATGQTEILRLVARAASEPNQVILEARRGDGELLWEALIDRAAFESGAPPAEFVQGPFAEASAREELFATLRGMPAERPYQPGRPAYLRTPLQDDALTCQRIASQVFHPETGVRRRFRSDVWLCDDLPFGVASMEFSVYDLSGRLLNRQTWTVRAFDNDCAD